MGTTRSGDFLQNPRPAVSCPLALRGLHAWLMRLEDCSSNCAERGVRLRGWRRARDESLCARRPPSIVRVSLFQVCDAEMGEGEGECPPRPRGSAGSALCNSLWCLNAAELEIDLILCAVTALPKASGIEAVSLHAYTHLPPRTKSKLARLALAL